MNKHSKSKRLINFEKVLGIEPEPQDPGIPKEPGFIQGWIEALERPHTEMAEMRRQAKEDVDKDEIDMDYGG